MVQPQQDAQPSAERSAEVLLVDCAAGNQQSFRELYEQMASTAYGLALRVLRDDQLAQDAVQEAFTQVWSESATFDSDRASARSWIMTLVWSFWPFS
ncbi:MAG: sigma factor [bacterium]|nr:sigma factor [bacterium]